LADEIGQLCRSSDISFSLVEIVARNGAGLRRWFAADIISPYVTLQRELRHDLKGKIIGAETIFNTSTSDYFPLVDYFITVDWSTAALLTRSI